MQTSSRTDDDEKRAASWEAANVGRRPPAEGGIGAQFMTPSSYAFSFNVFIYMYIYRDIYRTTVPYSYLPSEHQRTKARERETSSRV